ncbi:unnamed protein product [Camellia sinensis]
MNQLCFKLYINHDKVDTCESSQREVSSSTAESNQDRILKVPGFAGTENSVLAMCWDVLKLVPAKYQLDEVVLFVCLCSYVGWISESSGIGPCNHYHEEGGDGIVDAAPDLGYEPQMFARMVELLRK